jgi:hypothetical protein
MQQIQVTSTTVEEIRELVLSDSAPALDQVAATGISLPAAVSLCLSLDHWSTNNVLSVERSAKLSQFLGSLQDAQTVYRLHPPPQADRDSLFNSRTTEFFSIRSQSHFPSGDWDDYCQRFKKGLSENGFSSKYALALAGAFNEMADNVIQHSQTDIPHPSFSGLAGYHVAANYMAFSVGDLGIGALLSLRTNPQYSALEQSEEALLAIARRQATRRQHQTYGGGFQQVFKSIADLNGVVRLRSGDSLLEYSGVSTRTGDVYRKKHCPGLEISVMCRIGQPTEEICL